MNDDELLEVLHRGNQYNKKLHDIIAQATFAMAVEEELSKPGKTDINIFVDNGTEEEKCGICINGLWMGNTSAPAAFVKKQIDTVKRIAAEALKDIPDNIELLDLEPAFKKAEPKEETAKEIPKVAPVQQDEGRTEITPEITSVGQTKEAKVTSSVIIPDYLLRDEYFRNGKKIREIAQEYKVGPAALFKRIEKIKKQIEKTAKEDVRR